MVVALRHNGRPLAPVPIASVVLEPAYILTLSLRYQLRRQHFIYLDGAPQTCEPFPRY